MHINARGARLLLIYFTIFSRACFYGAWEVLLGLNCAVLLLGLMTLLPNQSEWEFHYYFLAKRLAAYSQRARTQIFTVLSFG